MAIKQGINEFLFDNFLDEEILSTFLPFHFVQWLFLLPKYKLYENLLVFNSVIVNCMSFFTVLVVLPIFIWHCMYSPSLGFFYIAVFDAAFHINLFITSYTLNMCYRKQNVELVLNVQRIFRMFKLNRYETLRSFNIISWITFVSFLIWNTVHLILFSLRDEVPNFNHVIVSWISLHLDLNVICACRIIGLIEIILQFWISEVRHLVAISELTNQRNGSVNLIQILCMDDEDNNENPGNTRYELNDETKQQWERLFQAYKKILETYEIYKKIFKILILYHGIRALLYTISFSAFMLQADFSNPRFKFNLAKFLLTFVWMVKDLILECIICFKSQSLYATFVMVKSVCAFVERRSKNSDGRRVGKNVIRLNNAVFEEMEACRLYKIDATLPLRLVSCTANYIIIMIQFMLKR